MLQSIHLSRLKRPLPASQKSFVVGLEKQDGTVMDNKKKWDSF